MLFTSKRFDSLPNFHYNNHIKDGGDYLYKIPRVAGNVLFFLRFLPREKGVIWPTRLLINEKGELYGYQMKKIPDAINIYQYTRKEKEIDVLKNIKDLFSNLEFVHKYIIVGDVRNDNMLLTENQAYICDFDSSCRKKDISLFTLMYYGIVFNDNYDFYNCSQICDTLKMVICALSVYYKADFERLMGYKSINFDDLYELLKEIGTDKYILEYMKSLLNDVKNKKRTATESFLEYIPFINLPSEKEKNKVRELLK